MRFVKLTPLILGMLLLSSSVLSAEEEKSGYEVVDEAAIYHGVTTDIKHPAVCDVDKVYMAIPEYRKIVERDIGEDDPQYWNLMRAASDKFRAALEGAAEDGGYDSIGGKGSIVAKGKAKPVPDITKLVIKKLPE